MPIAFTRAVSPRLADCELTHLQRMPIDVAKADAQHSAYERALEQAGYDVVRLPVLPDHPDGVFVENTALILDGHAVILRPGAASRAAETSSTADGLAGHFDLHQVTDGHVDGGDVLRIGRMLYVGLSTPTMRGELPPCAKSLARSASMSSRPLSRTACTSRRERRWPERTATETPSSSIIATAWIHRSSAR